MSGKKPFDQNNYFHDRKWAIQLQPLPPSGRHFSFIFFITLLENAKSVIFSLLKPFFA